MTTLAATAPTPLPPPSSANNGAKRKFFQTHAPNFKYYRPRNEVSGNRSSTKNSCSSSSSTCTFYGSAFSPYYRNKRYIVACTSNGCIVVWDPRPYSASPSYQDENEFEKSESSAPVLVVSLGGGNGSSNKVMYDLQFVQTGNGDHLLVASGDPGILIYKWCDFEAAIDAREGRHTLSKRPKCQDPQRNESSPHHALLVDLRPITTFQPHPSPVTSFGESVEINSTSYSESDGTLYGAAGDVFGCYQWDLCAEKLLGNFGGASRFDGGGHRDYLHVVKSIPGDGGVGSRCVITGGEDGNVGFWDGKDRKLIEMKNVRTTMDKNKNSVTSNTTVNNRGFMSNTTTHWNNGSNLWVSSMDMNGNWLSVGGGAEHVHNAITSRSGPSSAGFMTLWHLPTRTFTSGCVTRENVNTVAYNSSLDCFVSGGNDGMISFWESSSLAHSGRSWSTPSATYTISVDSESMVVGGSGGTLDWFMDRVKVSQFWFNS